jgi:hypothetical protein
MKVALGPTIILAAMLPSHTLWAQQDTLTGTVADSTGKPIVGVAVSAPAVGVEAKTDSRGRFALGPLHPDTVLIRFGSGPTFRCATRGPTPSCSA